MRPDEALAEAARAGIHRLQIPTPFAVGRVNCYLLEDDPLTLIDTGPNSGKALDDLEQGLAARGRSIEDLELVIITHQHIDHLGLVEIIAKRSGAQVAALGLAARRLANFADDAELDDRFSADLMLRSGIPENVVIALRGVSRSFRAWGSHAYVTRPLADGETLELRDRKLQVFHRPGHSPSDTIFWDADRQILIAGDHLLAHISSNPLITRALDGSAQRTHALAAYLDSLAKTRAMPARIVLSGHGEPITNHAELIDSRIKLTARRKAKIMGLISDQPRSGHEIAQELWGDVAVTQAFLTLSEVIGHVDLLMDEGLVTEVEADGVVRYLPATAAGIGQD
ncbi:MAG: MBL fold metallo-hydrolase [Actinomycetota bacterium]|nr:MBL fold metallo-hydrolase [Actinomycetota bacterium]